jgi:Uma2 family endonuclease
MIKALTKSTYSPEELLALPDGKNYELVNGELVERNVSVLSSWVGGRLFQRVDTFCEQHGFGQAWPADNGIQCFPMFPNKVRKPDVSFVRRERITPQLFEQGFLRIAPDMVAEVISPNDTAEELDEKITDYQEAGVRLIWIVNPIARTVRVYRAGSSFALHEHQELDGEDVLPGFRCLVRDLFPPAELIAPAAAAEKPQA